MYKQRIDLTGQRFNRLFVNKYLFTKNKKAYWKVTCDCGTVKTVSTQSLRGGTSTSCGCLRTELLVRRFTKHGERYTNFYLRWLSMRERCKPTNKNKKYYFESGIAVCKRWEDFLKFKEDMFDDFEPSLSLERINVKKGYSPSNCTWIPISQQADNTRKTIRLIFNNKETTISKLSNQFGIPKKRLYERLQKLHQPIEQALLLKKYQRSSKSTSS